MKHARIMHGVRVLVLATFATSCGVLDLTQSRRGQQPAPVLLTAVGPRFYYGYAGETVAQTPTVRVTDMTGSIPIGGALVTFTITAGGGSIARDSVISGQDGLASVGSWRLGSMPPVNTLDARVAGAPAVAFTANFPLVSALATYDLQTIAGQHLPITSSGGETITGGHYTFFGGGDCSSDYEGSPVEPSVSLTCVQRDQSTILFYLYSSGPFYPGFDNGLVATGTLSSDTMMVNYEDWWGQEPEVYVRHGNSVADRRSGHFVRP